MKTFCRLFPRVAFLLALGLGSIAGAAEKWEGSDSFDGDQKWKKRALQGREFIIRQGQLVYSAYESIADNAAYWLWGNKKAGMPIPTDRSWEISQDAIFADTSPASNYYDVGIGLALYADAGKGRYRCVWARLRAVYIFNTLVDGPQAESDFNFEVRNGEDGGGPADDIGAVLSESNQFTLVFRHDALSRTDSFQVKDSNTGEVLYVRNGPSTLSQARTCLVGPWISIDQNSTWPAGSTYLAADNWILRSITPDPINLNPKTSTANGVAYSVAVTALGMTGAKLTGTVALMVGSASASLPISGSIDKNGYFALTAKGAGANKGFGCVLLYNVATGTYRPSKSTITAPKQKAIRF